MFVLACMRRERGIVAVIARGAIRLTRKVSVGPLSRGPIRAGSVSQANRPDRVGHPLCVHHETCSASADRLIAPLLKRSPAPPSPTMSLPATPGSFTSWAHAYTGIIPPNTAAKVLSPADEDYRSHLSSLVSSLLSIVDEGKLRQPKRVSVMVNAERTAAYSRTRASTEIDCLGKRLVSEKGPTEPEIEVDCEATACRRYLVSLRPT